MDSMVVATIAAGVVGAIAAFAVNVWWSRWTAPRPAWMLRIETHEVNGDETTVHFRAANCGAGAAFGILLSGVKTTYFDFGNELIPMCGPGDVLLPWDAERSPTSRWVVVVRFSDPDAGVRISWNESHARTRKRQSSVLQFRDFPSADSEPGVWYV